MPFDFAISALVTLLVVVDPVGLVPAFLGVTEGLSASLRRKVALRSCLIAAAILLGASLVGDWLLRQLGITLSAFRIAGGLLLFVVASEMVLGLRVERDAKNAEDALDEHARDIAAFPLAIPLMAGPGAITAAILLAGQAAYRPQWLVALLAVIVVVMVACLLSFWAAERIGKLLGVTGNVVLSRLLGVILAALAVQYVIDGVRTALAG
jgi:multiple antibiotic resistance protein